MTFKSYIYAGFVGMAFLATGCSSDDFEYTPGEQSSGAFFVDTPSEIELNTAESSVVLKVGRTGVDAPSTIQVASADTSGLFQIPSTVQFNGNELYANLEIKYDPSKIVDGLSYAVNLDVTPATEYGQSKYNVILFTDPWQTIGKCTYVEALINSLYNVGDFTYQVPIQEHKARKGYFRLVGPYSKGVYPFLDDSNYPNKKNYMYINAENPERVYMEEYWTGLTLNSSEGEIIATSRAYNYLIHGNSPDAIANAGWYGTYKDGYITFPKDGFLVTLTSEIENGWYKGDSDGKFMIAMPGYSIADYAATVTYAGRFTAPDETVSLVVDVQLSKDVELAKIAAVLTSDADAAVNGIIDGSVESVELKNTGSDQRVQLPIEGSGRYVIALVYYGEGEPQGSVTTSVEVELGGSKWQDLGDVALTDGWLLPLAGIDPNDNVWYATMQNNVENPALYRVVDMFGGQYPYAGAMVSGTYNIQVNATDPNNVYIEPQSTGSHIFEDGVASITTVNFIYMAQGVTPEQIIEAGFNGTFADNVFRFPGKGNFVSFDDGKNWYKAKNPYDAVMEIEAEPAAQSLSRSMKNQPRMSAGEVKARLAHPVLFQHMSLRSKMVKVDDRKL